MSSSICFSSDLTLCRNSSSPSALRFAVSFAEGDGKGHVYGTQRWPLISSTNLTCKEVSWSTWRNCNRCSSTWWTRVKRTSLVGMLGPLNGAVGDMAGATLELESLPFVGPLIGEKLQRTMRGISAAQSMVGQVAAKYNQGVSVASQVQERLGSLKEQTGKAGAAINRIAGNISASLENIVPTGNFAPELTPAAEAVKPFPHLLIVQPLEPAAQPYYFNLDTAAFDELRRQTAFRWAGQERLSRSVAQQAVGLGEDKLSLKGRFPQGTKVALNNWTPYAVWAVACSH
ncbi:hypothetical protein PS880_05622 [Pseudomonas fluorescens]|uniref:Uncharacterized protein n=1 Tax=Pseudomonas fluorescens TaxID=294 RepID=A0A5E7PZ98_PSEFL|nr:hypothetical protein PS880_05622 [Pseudomonas fluorescens]